jgi:chromosome segregation ATPase
MSTARDYKAECVAWRRDFIAQEKLHAKRSATVAIETASFKLQLQLKDREITKHHTARRRLLQKLRIERQRTRTAMGFYTAAVERMEDLEASKGKAEARMTEAAERAESAATRAYEARARIAELEAQLTVEQERTATQEHFKEEAYKMMQERKARIDSLEAKLGETELMLIVARATVAKAPTQIVATADPNSLAP